MTPELLFFIAASLASWVSAFLAIVFLRAFIEDPDIKLLLFLFGAVFFGLIACGAALWIWRMPWAA